MIGPNGWKRERRRRRFPASIGRRSISAGLAGCDPAPQRRPADTASPASRPNGMSS